MKCVVRLISYFFVFAILSGCWAATTRPGDSLPYRMTKMLDRAIGKNSKQIGIDLGLPDQKITDGNRTYLMYHTMSTGTDFLMIGWVPVPMGEAGPESTIHCVRFELDSSNYVSAYLVKSWRMFTAQKGPEIYRRCRMIFWTRKEMLLNIRTLPEWSDSTLGRYVEDNLKQLSSSEYKSGYLDFYKNIAELEPEVAYKSLCRAADNGAAGAAEKVAYVFEMVKMGYLEPNYIQAFIWYSKAGYQKLQAFVDFRLSNTETAEAQEALRNWKPGECEINLVPDRTAS